MLVATRVVGSRVVNLTRTVLPYATWVTAVIHLGYAGYNLYQMYQRYVVQEQRDAIQGIRRSFEEAIEMVVRPKRKKRVEKDSSSAQTFQAAPTTQTVLSSDNQNVRSDGLTRDNNPNIPMPAEINQSCGSYKAPEMVAINETNGVGDDDDEITIVHDTRTMVNVNNNPPLTDNLDGNNILDDGNVSTVSTSLESTDSNNGIIKDMYTECFICATSLDNPNKPVATLPFCLHPFHKSCLDGILKWHQKCPVCDFHIFTPI